MILFSMLSWWYTAGWSALATRIGHRINTVMESFSVSLLMGSLFEPFRQISAGQVRGGGFDVQLRAFGDRLFSRLFGAVIRSLFIGMGLVGAFLTAIVGMVQLAVWPFVPFLPFIGIGLAIAGVSF
jgi:hypothetical protein